MELLKNLLAVKFICKNKPIRKNLQQIICCEQN